MIVFDFIRKFRNKRREYKYAQMLNNFIPVSSSFGNDIYASDVVQQAVKCVADEMTKLTPHHIRKKGVYEFSIVNDSVETVLNNPNDNMTTSDLIEKIIWLLFIDYNAYVIPTYDVVRMKDGSMRKRYTGLWPVRPAFVEMLQDPSGRLGIHFVFSNDYECILAYDDVIHLKMKYSVNEYFGGDESGRPNHKPLIETLKLNDDVMKSISKALKSSCAINGIVKYNTYLDEGKTENAIKEFEEKAKNSETGILPLDAKGDYMDIHHDPKVVDSTVLQFIDEKILRNFGLNVHILNGDYSKDQYDAFYQKTLEPLIVKISQEFTKKLFTDRERGLNNVVEFFPERLIFMTNNEKIELFNMLIDTSSCYKNELRYAFGLEPSEEFNGEIAMSSQKHFAENGTSKNRSGKEGGTENE